MGDLQVFAYDRPSRDTLAGIYVEASDEAVEQPGAIDTEPASQPSLPAAALFGLTLTAADSTNAKQSNAQPGSQGSALPG
jgi:hypothetical protein